MRISDYIDADLLDRFEFYILFESDSCAVNYDPMRH